MRRMREFLPRTKSVPGIRFDAMFSTVVILTIVPWFTADDRSGTRKSLATPFVLPAIQLTLVMIHWGLTTGGAEVRVR